MIEQLEQIERQALGELESIQDDEALQRWKVTHLGRSSPLMKTFDGLGKLTKEERPIIGRRANEVKRALEAAFEERSQALRQVAIQRALAAERLDVSLPGRPALRGRLHPTTQTLREMYRVLGEMGFQVYRSREVESDEFNFQLLNFPPNHPAREMQDSFYVDTGTQRGDNPILLRTHTSPGQIRAMREYAALNPTGSAAGADHPARDVLPLRADHLPLGDAVQPARRAGSGPPYHHGRSQRHAERLRPAHVRAAGALALPRLALPVHRAERRDGHRVLRVRRRGLPGLQAQRLAGDPGVRHGAPGGAAQWRLRPGALQRLCLRHGA